MFTTNEIKKTEKKERGLFKRASEHPFHKRKSTLIGVFGEPGTGKTHFLLTYPDDYKIVYIGTENGLFPILPDNSEKDIMVIELFDEGIDNREIITENNGVVTVNAEAILDRFNDSIREIGYFIKQSNDRSKIVVCIDSWGDLWKIARLWRAQRYAKFAPSKQQKEKIELGIGLQNLGGWDDAISWTQAVEKIITPLNYLKSLNVNILLTSKTKEVHEVAMPSWHKDTEGMMDIILMMYVKNNDFFADLKKVRTSISKKLLGKTIRDPTYEKVLKTIKGEN